MSKLTNRKGQKVSATIISQDEYQTVFNSQLTYEGLARVLEEQSVVFAWTDNQGTQLDILMVYKPDQFGRLQRGMNSNTDLFVAVSHFGMFGFELNGLIKYPSYVGEKLNLGNENSTTVALADLINGVCAELEKVK